MAKIFEIVGLSGPALTIFLICVVLGKALEKRASKEWRLTIQKSLKERSWIALIDNLTLHSDSMLDRFFGKDFLSWKAFRRSAAITVVATYLIIFFLLLWLAPGIVHDIREGGYVSHRDTERILVSLDHSVGRLPIAILLDFLTLLRVRVFCRNLSSPIVLTSKWAVSLCLDLSTFLFLLSFTILLQAVGPSPSNIWDIWNGDFYTDEMKAYEGNGGIAAWAWGEFVTGWDETTQLLTKANFASWTVIILDFGNMAVASLIPSLLFYLYVSAALISRAMLQLLKPMAFLSSRLEFDTPFSDFGYIVGLFLAGIISGLVWLHRLL